MKFDMSHDNRFFDSMELVIPIIWDRDLRTGSEWLNLVRLKKSYSWQNVMKFDMSHDYRIFESRVLVIPTILGSEFYNRFRMT